MARRSRAVVETAKLKYRVWRIAIYIRLSKEDARCLDESESVTNQRQIIEDHIAGFNDGDEYIIVDEYVDDGFSGTDFERPQVKRLLDDAKTGRINTIVVKDLSRFGRNYIMVGQYLDYIFPAYGIRFIAINDNVDTADRNSTGMDMMPIMNVFNEWHSANTSKKIRAVLEASQKAGKYTSGCYPYGYLVGDDENRTAIIDEPAAEIVRRIYDMRIQGLSPYRIARTLSDEGIPNPTLYRTKKDGSKINRQAPNWWSHKTVREMLADPTYKGCTVQHRRSTISYKNHNTYWLPQEEWIVKRNAHEPIVSEEVFRAANFAVDNNAREKGITKSRKYTKRYALSGKVFCGECGGKCKRKKIYGEVWYGCDTHVKDKKKCRQLPVRADMVEAAFVNMMNKLIYGRDAVLLPMSGRLLGGGDKEVLGRLESLNTELAMVAERRQAADKFFAKGLLDTAVYREELDALAQKEKEINVARACIEGAPDLDFDRQLALNELLKYTAKAEQLTAFSDEVFTKYVDRVIIFSRKEVGFVMKCGPVFRERI